MPRNINMDFEPNPKQDLAWNYLMNTTTTEVLFGGGAGGGKSHLGCFWLIYCCLSYPKSRWLMGRSVLKSLKESTLNTFFDTAILCNLKVGSDFKYNGNGNVINFTNGSQIVLKDLYLYPSDPNFDNLGSTEFTGAFIDECNQISDKAKNVVTSRIRYKLDEFKIIPKVLMTCNPSKNWVYHEFYKPSKENTLPPYRAFVQALVQDNPKISKHYIENLKKLDEINRQRLLYGNWEYDDDPTRMIEYDKILDLWTNSFITREGKMYITADIARYGIDKTVICIWDGLNLIKIKVILRSDLVEVQNAILELQNTYHIPNSNTIVDSDGLGAGVKDNLRCLGFTANSRPFNLNYKNLKAECYYELAKLINESKIYIKDEQNKTEIIQELEQIKTRNQDKDGKLEIMGKDEIKQSLGRSPDFSDSIMLRMYFEVNTIKQLAPTFTFTLNSQTTSQTASNSLDNFLIN